MKFFYAIIRGITALISLLFFFATILLLSVATLGSELGIEIQLKALLVAFVTGVFSFLFYQLTVLED